MMDMQKDPVIRDTAGRESRKAASEGISFAYRSASAAIQDVLDAAVSDRNDNMALVQYGAILHDLGGAISLLAGVSLAIERVTGVRKQSVDSGSKEGTDGNESLAA